ncbi:MAG: hypothetical protein J6252_00820, partial [Clostridia bacterium]|nr:hypothetical protein [Clostridia bacterium]
PSQRSSGWRRSRFYPAPLCFAVKTRSLRIIPSAEYAPGGARRVLQAEPHPDRVSDIKLLFRLTALFRLATLAFLSGARNVLYYIKTRLSTANLIF